MSSTGSHLLGGQGMVWEKERKILTAISSDASPLGSFETIITINGCQ